MEKLKLPIQVEYILNKLVSKGYEAYVVGGCVRDSIMGVEPNDWDICTNALPNDIMSVFENHKIIPTGLKHGTVTLVIDNKNYEITTFRIDGEYTDGRHPDEVMFVNDLKLDLMRRDFTINAMAYNHKCGIVDYFGGIDDIKNKIIRCVGNPYERFQEDALRMMRAIRFSIKYEFDIEEKTMNSLIESSDLLKKVSMERINSELSQTISYNLTTDKLSHLVKLLYVVVPELKEKELDELCCDVSGSYGSLEFILACLFDFELDGLKEILQRLRYSNDVIDSVVKINKYGHQILENIILTDDIHKSEYLEPGYYERKLLSDIGYDLALDAIDFAMIHSPTYETILIALYNRVVKSFKKDSIYSLSRLDINGNDLINIGYKGKDIGTTLNLLLDMVMRDEIVNVKPELIAKAIKMKK